MQSRNCCDLIGLNYNYSNLRNIGKDLEKEWEIRKEKIDPNKSVPEEIYNLLNQNLRSNLVLDINSLSILLFWKLVNDALD